MRVIQMLERLHSGEEKMGDIIEKVKEKQAIMWGFGHRVYKSFDPRTTILKEACNDLLETMGKQDPLLEIARELEYVAVNDEYFLERKLYPNVDFYSGLLLRAIGIPLNMFTVMFAIGRMPGWIAHWAEAWRASSRINRPRQLYTGHQKRKFVPMDRR